MGRGAGERWSLSSVRRAHRRTSRYVLRFEVPLGQESKESKIVARRSLRVSCLSRPRPPPTRVCAFCPLTTRPHTLVVGSLCVGRSLSLTHVSCEDMRGVTLLSPLTLLS